MFVSPPFVAHALAPFSSLPLDVVWILWTVAGVLALIAAMRVVERDTLVARAPWLVFSFVYLWGSLWMGQVNLFTLAGLLLAFGARSDRLAGFGLALAVVTRALPGAFAVVLVVERRWRALAWSALFAGLAVLIPPRGLDQLPLGRPRGVRPAHAARARPDLARPVPAGVGRGGRRHRRPSWPSPRSWRRTAGCWPGLPWASRSCSCPPMPGTTGSPSRWRQLLLLGDGSRWGRAALLGFVVVSFLPIGPLSSLVALATLLAILLVSARGLRDAWPRIRPKGAGILGQP